jgi:hypothetical protein
MPERLRYHVAYAIAAPTQQKYAAYATVIQQRGKETESKSVDAAPIQ